MSERPIAVVESSAAVGGAELSLLPVIARLAAERRVVAFLPSPGPLAARLGESGAELAGGFAVRGALARASRHYGGAGSVAIAPAALAQQARLLAALRRLRPAVVYCNGFRAQVGATLPARLAGAAVLWHVRDFGGSGALGRIWARLARLCSMAIANSHATAGQPGLKRLPAEPIVIPNGVDRGRFRPRAKEPGGRPVIGMVGHLTPWKGHLRFLRVLAAARARHPEVEGRIAGAEIYDTAEHADFPSRLSEETRSLGLEEACSIEALAPEEMPGWLSALSVLVHCPDRPEPFGRALVEAMAVGVPVLSAGGGGAPEVIGDAGIVVRQGDEEALTEALLELLGDPGGRARLATAGPERVRREFDEAACADRVAAEVLSAG